MVILLGFYKRRPDLTHEQFLEHWHTVHAPMGLASGLEKYLSRYVQHNLVPMAGAGTPDGFDFDGYSEVWFHDHDAIAGFQSDPHFLNNIFPDEPNFIDMTATRWVVVDEPHVVVNGAGGY